MVDKKKFLESIGFDEVDSIQKKRNILFDIENELIPLLLEELIRDKIYCKCCDEYYDKNSFITTTETKVITKTTFTDGGYGDSDRIGDVEYLFYYLECPFCKTKQEKNRTFLRIIKEWSRR